MEFLAIHSRNDPRITIVFLNCTFLHLIYHTGMVLGDSEMETYIIMLAFLLKLKQLNEQQMLLEELSSKLIYTQLNARKDIAFLARGLGLI